jgi:hypothetical protein
VIKHIIKRADALVPGDVILAADRRSVALTVSAKDTSEAGVVFIRGQAPSLSYSEWTWFDSDLVAVKDPEHGTTVQRFEILIDYETKPEPDDEASTEHGIKVWVETFLGNTGRLRNVEVKEVMR